MRVKQQKMAEKAWIFRFWGVYSKLPETYKMGFCDMVQNLSQEVGNQEQDRHLQIMMNPVMDVQDGGNR